MTGDIFAIVMHRYRRGADVFKLDGMQFLNITVTIPVPITEPKSTEPGSGAGSTDRPPPDTYEALSMPQDPVCANLSAVLTQGNPVRTAPSD